MPLRIGEGWEFVLTLEMRSDSEAALLGDWMGIGVMSQISNTGGSTSLMGM